MKKLRLNKKTISNLDALGKKEMANAKAGHVQKGCWENLWTMYECEVVYTGDSEDPLPKTT